MILTIVLGASLMVTFREAAVSPNSVMLKDDGDGFKNYYTPWYHAKHDSTLNWFGGMNHPYGDHIVFSDAQPAVSNTIWILSGVVDLSDNTTGIIHFLLLLSWILAGFFIYKILRELNLPVWYAIVCAAIIVAMSPQLWRFRGHYALAYVCYIPGLWWLLIRYMKSPDWKHTAYIVLYGIFWSGIQPYYIMLGMLLLCATWATALFYRRWRMNWRMVLPQAAAQIILPLLIFAVYLAMTDPVEDRPQNPFGFFSYRASWWSIFTPAFLPHIEYAKHIISYPQVYWEGFAYVGIPAAVFFFWFCGRYGVNTIRTNFKKFPRITTHNWLAISVIAGTAIMLFSQRYPFIRPLQPIVEWLPFLKQFRSIGRFAWIFYYIWTVFTAYSIWHSYRYFKLKGKLTWLGPVFVVLFLGIMSAEAITWHKFVRERRPVITNKFIADEKNELPENEWMTKVEVDKYQGMIVLPYFHYGSENITISNDAVVLPAFSASLKTGLPLMNVMMSRTSFEQTWKQVRMTQEDRDVNPMAEELPAGPHLIVKYKNYGEPYPYPLLQKARMIFENEAVEVYEFVREDLKVNQTELANVIIAELESQDTLYQHSSGFLLTKPDAGFLYANYDDAEKEKAFQGAAGREEVGWEYNFLIRAPLPISSPGEYAFSIWMYMKKDLRPLTELGLEQFNTDTVIQYDDYKSGGVLCKMTYGSWGLVENSMYVKDPKNTVVAIVRKDSKKPKWVQFDEFMIRNTNTDAYLQRDGHIIKNNRWYETDRTAQMDSVRILSLDSVLSAR